MGKNELSEAKRRSVNRRRFLILFLIWLMFIGLFAGIIGVGVDNEIARIVLIVALCVLTFAYWMTFYIVFRRQRQKGNK